MWRAARSGSLQVASRLIPAQYDLQSISFRGLADAAAPITATLFPGDGIGPEIANAVKEIFKGASAMPS